MADDNNGAVNDILEDTLIEEEQVIDTELEDTDAEDTGDQLDEKTHKGYQKAIAELRAERRAQKAELQELREQMATSRKEVLDKLAEQSAAPEVDLEDELEYESEKKLYREIKGIKQEIKAVKTENEYLKTTIAKTQYETVVSEFNTTVSALSEEYGIELDEKTKEELANDSVNIAKAQQAGSGTLPPVKKAAEMAFKAKFFDDIVSGKKKQQAQPPSKNKELLNTRRPVNVSSAQKAVEGNLDLDEAMKRAYAEVYGQ